MGILSVMIDSREPEWVQSLTFGGVPTAVVPLDAGDLLVACDDTALLGIERKTATDFLNTLRDDRLFPQLVRMRGITPWSYLVICGDLREGASGKCWADSRETGWNWASVAGALLTAQEIGVHVLQIAGDHEYDQAVIRLANRERSQLRISPARDATLTGQAEMILAGLPGIGGERAQALLSHCGTPAAAITYLTSDDTHDIPGIGYQTKLKVRKALGLEWDEALELTVREKNEQGELLPEKEKVLCLSL
jgi:ERCC4-type nuclease